MFVVVRWLGVTASLAALVLAPMVGAGACASGGEAGPGARNGPYDDAPGLSGSSSGYAGDDGSYGTTSSSGTTGTSSGTTSGVDTTSSGGSTSSNSASSGGIASGSTSSSGWSTSSSSGSTSGTSTSSGRTGDGGPATGAIAVEYKVEVSGATSSYVSAELLVTNESVNAVQLSDLKVRYYFTNPFGTPTMTEQWYHIAPVGGGSNQNLSVSAMFYPISPSLTGADTYVEFSFSSSYEKALAPGDACDFSWQFQSPDTAQDHYTQTDAYSFNAADTSLTSWNHVVALVAGSLAWGTPPQ